MHRTQTLLFCSHCAAEPAYRVSFDALGEETTKACRDCIEHFYFSATISFAYVEVEDSQGLGVSFLWNGTYALERWIQTVPIAPTARGHRANETTISSAPAIINTLEEELTRQRQTRAQNRATHLKRTSLIARLRRGKTITAERHRRQWIRDAFKINASVTHPPIPIIHVEDTKKKAGSIATLAFRRFGNGAFTRGERARRKWYRDAFNVGQPSAQVSKTML